MLTLLVTTAFAQTGSGYDLTCNTIDGGGGSNSGGACTLSGGFWDSPAVLAQFHVYLPLLLK